jgi:hypothetical protein
MGRELQNDMTKNDAVAKTEHQRKMRIRAKAVRQRSRVEKRD